MTPDLYDPEIDLIFIQPPQSSCRETINVILLGKRKEEKV